VAEAATAALLLATRLVRAVAAHGRDVVGAAAVATAPEGTPRAVAGRAATVASVIRKAEAGTRSMT
jgi:hypothetical protein